MAQPTTIPWNPFDSGMIVPLEKSAAVEEMNFRGQSLRIMRVTSQTWEIRAIAEEPTPAELLAIALLSDPDATYGYGNVYTVSVRKDKGSLWTATMSHTYRIAFA